VCQLLEGELFAYSTGSTVVVVDVSVCVTVSRNYPVLCDTR